MNVSDPIHWIRNVKIGDILTFRDEQTLLDLVKIRVNGGLKDGLNVTVSRVTWFHEKSNSCSWALLETESTLVLVAKIVPPECDLRIMFVPPDFTPGDRVDVIENDCQWLFERPQNIHSYTPSELTISETILNEFNGQSISYKRKGGTLYGETGNRDFCGVTEWRSDDEGVDNPELILFEIGGHDDERGGYLKLYQGVTVSPHEVEFMPV